MARRTRMPKEGVAWRAPAEIKYNQREDGSHAVEIGCTLEQVMHNLDLPLPNEADATQMRLELGSIIGQWQPSDRSIEADKVTTDAVAAKLAAIEDPKKGGPDKSTKAHKVTTGAVAAKLAAIVKDPKKGGAVYAVSAGSGYHDEVNIQAAYILAKFVARHAGATDIGSGHQLLADYRENAPNLASAAQEALDEIKSIRGKRGRPPHTWYDDFLRFLLVVAEKNGITPTLGDDDLNGQPVGTIYCLACAFEQLLPPDMRSTSPSAMLSRLYTSKENIGWTRAR